MDNINYDIKPNYNDLMNAFARSLKVRVKKSVPPVPPVPVRPTMTITSTTVESGEATDNSEINLTFTSSENTTDFTSLNVQISGGTISNFTGSGKEYTAVFTPSGYATYTIFVPANSFTDGSGNGNIVSNEFEWTYTDTIRPTMTITSSTVTSGETSNDSYINLIFEPSENTNNFTENDIKIVGSGGTISDFGKAGDKYVAVFTPDYTTTTTYTISVPANSFTDGSGNGNIASNDFVWTYKNTIQPFPSNYDDQWYLENIKFKDYFQNETQRQDLLSQLANSSVKIAINDDGVQQKDDNNPNNTEINDFNKLDKSLSKGFNANGADDDRWWPINKNDDHGTNCGSMAVSSGNKLYGTAPGLPFVSTRHDYSVTSMGNSLSYENQKIAVYSCSWGFLPGGTANVSQINDPIIYGSQTGRNGKGCVYVFSSGNNSDVGDSAVFQYHANLAETLMIGATNIEDKRTYYSETGANLLCVAPGGEQQFDNNSNGVLVFNNKYDLRYVEGTSFSCPLVSGLCGVMLTLRNDLTWRDVKEIISKSCIKNDPRAGGSGADNTPWFNNQVGRPFNLQYGFGLIDYGTVISNTKNHVLLPEQNGFIVTLSESIDLSQPQEISFVIDGTNTIQINNDIPLTGNYKTFVIQEFVIVFGSLQDGSDDNNEVHELSISLSVEGRYATDYTNQAITNGRKVSFDTTMLENYPVLSEFLKGEKLVGDGSNSSTWKLLLSDVDTITPLSGTLSHVEFRGYNTN